MREWTFLLYANGHNELEPETWRSVVDIQKQLPCNQVNIAIQVSREKADIVNLLRPHEIHTDTGEQWSGVRRYVITKTEQNLVDLLDHVNMANPNSLYHFIMWGIIKFPAKRYMLSITGHIYQFVGLCPDYTGEKPLMMGFPEISANIQSACNEIGVDMDILVLDTCYASTVEILYELGKYECPRIKNVLTYIGKGPLAGLPYGNVLSILDRSASAPIGDLLNHLVRQISINAQHYGLIALRINHELLELIKQSFSNLARDYKRYQEAYSISLSPEELLSNYTPKHPWSLHLRPIHRLLKAIIVAKRSAEIADNGLMPIHILYQKIPDERRKALYCRLAFVQQNHWAELLCDIPLSQIPCAPLLMEQPLEISKEILTAFICAGNEHLPTLTQQKLVMALSKEKNWAL